MDIDFDAYPQVTKDQITWNILHTNFRSENWNYQLAKERDLRKSLSFLEMTTNDIFSVSNDMYVSYKRHSLALNVSPSYVYNEFDGYGDEYWIVEMIVKVCVSL